MNVNTEIRKVLVAEDLEFIAAGIEKALNELEVQVIHTRYCDDAWLKLQKAQLDNEPFDLLITDLSFKQDHRKTDLKGGEDLIEIIRKHNLPCNIMVFSIEDRPTKIQNFFERLKINAYVLKGRFDRDEVFKAIQAIKVGKNYMSEEVKEKIHLHKNLNQVEEIDLLIVRQLCDGFTQDEISQLFQKKKIYPNSLSTIEKRLKALREDFSAKTNIELVLIFKELGLL